MEELKVLIDEQTIQEKVYELAKRIEKDYEGKDLTLVCILKGSTFFTVDLAKRIDKKLKLQFMKISSYGAEKISSGKINLELDLPESMENENLLIVEDIIDTRKNLKLFNKTFKRKKSSKYKTMHIIR